MKRITNVIFKKNHKYDSNENYLENNLKMKSASILFFSFKIKNITKISKKNTISRL